jgi:CHAD domain-containing protein
MDFGFQREEPTSEGVKRIAREQLERAAAELSAADPEVDLRVHSVRKRIKKLRGLLRLVRPSLGEEVFRRENVRLRDAGRRLASARRARAIVGAFDALIEHDASALQESARQSFRERLVQSRDQAIEALHGESHAAEVQAVLEDILHGIDDWPVRGEGWKVVRGGFRRNYRTARRWMNACLERPKTEHFHEWRKYAKHHFYHVRLLHRVWEAPLGALAESLEHLTELLGSEHDLDDLRMALLADPPPEELFQAAGTLLKAVEHRRAELRAEAFALGARVFAESPASATRRFGRYFAAWRAETGIDDGEDLDD